MTFETAFPVWNKLNSSQKNRLLDTLITRKVEKGTIIHSGAINCTGLLLIKSGQLRAYMISQEGREITLYRLFDYDMCLFSAYCIMRSIEFEIIVEAEKDTEVWVIPAEVYKNIMDESAAVANFTNEVMGTRFTDVMWLVEQILWKSLDKRLAKFLYEETLIEESNSLKITHERIANHIGSHREVITRMLHHFQNEDIVKLSRGLIEIIDEEKLISLLED
ncbi:MAG: Crp/Fnr family transcriptional regulator [Bacillota bacterium]|jgi:CRP/FNR family transcriptional regulator|nr:Crp/Fnr family transcriptional regulator [Bacillota bacterium]NLL26174.1 Crp/Fnr family transcriptional regulator [Erysipelotrichia bacterium]